MFPLDSDAAVAPDRVIPTPTEIGGEGGTDAGVLGLDKPFEVWRWVRDKCDWPPSVKLAYWVIYSHRNRDTGQTCPSIAKIAKGMGCTPKAAIAAIQVLEDIGAVTVQRRREPDSKEAAVNLYELRAPWQAEQRLKRAPRGKRNPSGHQDVLPNRHEVVSKGNNVVSNGNEVLPNGQEVMPNTPGGSVKTTQGVVSNRHSKEIEKSIGTSNGELTSPPASQSEKRPRRGKGPGPAGDEKPAKKVDPLAEAAQLILARFHDLRIEMGAAGISHEAWGGVKNTVKNVIKGKGGAVIIPVEDACAALDWAFTQNPDELARLNTFGLTALRSVWDKWQRKGKPVFKPGERPHYPVNEFS